MTAIPAEAVINSATFPAIKDAMLKQDKQANNFGIKNELEIKSQDPKKGSGRNFRAVVEFDIFAIPSGATLELAELRMFLKKQPNTARNYNVYRLQNSWLEGSSDGKKKNSAAFNGVTWIERQFGDNLWTGSGLWDWTAIGGDYLGTPTAIVATPGAGWMSWNVIGDVGAWYGGSASNFGWLIRDETENQKPKQSGKFSSRENGDPARSPSLVVTYLAASATVSTDTVPAGSYAAFRVTFANTGGPDGDQVNQVSFNIPAAWGQIPIVAGDYTITAPAGKSWNTAVVPPAPDGPQTVTATAVTGADDLADSETLDIVFYLRSPWVTGTTNWTFATVGAAGGTHLPADWIISTTAGTLDFRPALNQLMNSVSLTGFDISTSGTMGALSVRDGRGTAGGWSVTVASTDFVNSVNPSLVIPASGLSIPSVPLVTVVSGDTPPTAAAGSLAGTGLQLLNAPAGTGVGEYRVTPDLELIVPAATIIGTYSATITETIIVGL